MHLEIAHKFTQEQAKQRVIQGLNEARPKLEGQAVLEKEEWHDNTLDFGVLVQGQRITGSLEVEDQKFILDAKLPFLWRMFEGKIQQAIEEQIKTLK
jgi:hypothetical protein